MCPCILYCCWWTSASVLSHPCQWNILATNARARYDTTRLWSPHISCVESFVEAFTVNSITIEGFIDKLHVVNVGHVESLKSETFEGTGSVNQVCFKLGQSDADVYVIWRMTLRQSNYCHSVIQVVFRSLKVERLLSKTLKAPFLSFIYLCFRSLSHRNAANRYFCTGSLTYEARLAAKNSREQARWRCLSASLWLHIVWF
jgi:hypothetical protein